MFVVNCQATPIAAKIFFAHLHFIDGGQSKTVKAQIDSASTCYTIPMQFSIETAVPECEDLQDEMQNQHVWEPNNETKRSSDPCV